MKKYIKIFAILGIFLIGTISGYILLNRNPLSNAKGYTKNLKKEELLTYDKIYEGIYINNIDLKDLTKEEALNKIKQSLEMGSEFTLKHGNYEKKFLPKDIDFSYNYENLVNEAFNIGRSGSDDERIETLKNLIKNPKKFDVKSTFDLSKLNSIITEVSEKINSEPIDEKFSFSEGKISVVDGKVGLKVESEKILDNFNTVPVKFDLEIPTIVTEYKKIDKTLLSSIKGVIGEATTKFDNQPNRNNNIKIAANKINEFVVNPYDIKLFTTDVSRIPMPIEEVPDPSLPEGKKVVVEKGFPGYRGSSYKQKGNEKAELLNSDYYKPKKQIVKVGTKKEVKETIEKEKND